MTDQQKIFADQFLIDRNATQAALRSGYAVSSSRLVGHKLLNNPAVREYINEKLKELQNRVFVDMEFVINRFKDISDRCMQAEPVMVFDGEQWIESGEYKFDSSGAAKATEALAKIIGAYKEDNEQLAKQKITVTIE